MQAGDVLQVTVGWLQVVAIVSGVLATFAAAVAFIVGLHWRQDKHEEVCAERYARIDAHLENIKATAHERDERIAEKFQEGSQRMSAIDGKLDRVIERLGAGT